METGNYSQANLEDIKDIRKTRELSAILDADSFFYGIFQSKNLLRIGTKELDLLSQLHEDPDSIKVALRSDIFTHIPLIAFNKSQKKEYLSFSKAYQNLKKPHVSYDIIADKMVTVWAQESSHRKAISKLSKNQVHLSTVLIKYVLAAEAEGVFVHFLNESFELVVIKEGQLFFYSKYDYYALTDLLYFVRLAFENAELSPETDHLSLLGEVSYQDDRYNILSEYFAKLDFLDLVNGVKRRNSHKNAILHACHQCES